MRSRRGEWRRGWHGPRPRRSSRLGCTKRTSEMWRTRGGCSSGSSAQRPACKLCIAASRGAGWWRMRWPDRPPQTRRSCTSGAIGRRRRVSSLRSVASRLGNCYRLSSGSSSRSSNRSSSSRLLIHRGPHLARPPSQRVRHRASHAQLLAARLRPSYPTSSPSTLRGEGEDAAVCRPHNQHPWTRGLGSH